MDSVTIGTKNQIVIPKSIRDKIPGLRPGRKINIYSQDKNTVVIRVDGNNWLESSQGLMKQAWKNIDPIKELEKIRNEWQKK